jgi:ABC-2 type transport system permease protein
MSTRRTGTPSIPLVLVRLKLRLLRNRARQRNGMLGVVLGSAFACLGGLSGFLSMVVAGHASDARVSRVVVVLGATVVLVGWAILPLLSFGTDETLDPARLQLLPIENRQLIRGLMLASFIGYAPFAVLLTLAGVVVGYASGAATIVTLAAVVLLALLSVATARALATALASTVTSRRGRDLVFVAGAILAVGVQLVRFVRFDHINIATWNRVSDVMRWTPPGALGQAIVDAHTSHVARAVVELVPALIVLPVLLALWGRALERTLTVVSGGSTNTRATKQPGHRSSLLPRWVPILRPTAAGAVAAKELRYVTRDPRRKVAFGQLLAFGVGAPIWFAVTSGSLSPKSVVIASLAGYLALIGATNQFGFDGAALWIDIVAGNRVRDELVGKNIALLVQVLPVVFIGSTVLAAVSGGWAYIPVALVVAAAGLGAGLGVANVISVRFPQRVPETKNPFGGGGGGQGCVTGSMLFVGMLIQAVLLIPVAIAVGAAAALWPVGLVVVAPACALYGYALWRGGIAMAERWAWWRQPELLAAVDPRRGA